MPLRETRAVVRGIDILRKATQWAPSGSREIHQLLMAILPPSGENFLVVWEEREKVIQSASVGAVQA